MFWSSPRNCVPTSSNLTSIANHFHWNLMNSEFSIKLLSADTQLASFCLLRWKLEKRNWGKFIKLTLAFPSKRLFANLSMQAVYISIFMINLLLWLWSLNFKFLIRLNSFIIIYEIITAIRIEREAISTKYFKTSELESSTASFKILNNAKNLIHFQCFDNSKNC